MRPITYRIEKRHPGSLARAGVIETPHGAIETPAFVAVGTKATVKGIAASALRDIGVQAIIGNGYHLYLEPGAERVARAGGLGSFMGWSGPTMTDSGGFQVFSLGDGFGKKISKLSLQANEAATRSAAHPTVWNEEIATSHGKLALIDDDGVSFTSHLDGSLHRFTPERSIEIQHALGADIMFAFDECTSPAADWAYQKEAMERTHRWAKRSLAAHRQHLPREPVSVPHSSALYGIVQGGRYPDLRIESARALARMDFDGYGIGGSFSKDDILGVLDRVNRELPEDKPRHLLGIGEPEDLFIGAAAGIDTFDCVLPTRNGRSGTLYTRHGKINIENATYKDDLSPIDETCECGICASHTRAYLAHLFRAKEMLGPVLASMHNLYFLADLAKRIRQSIIDGNFEAFRDAFLANYEK